MFTYIYIVNIYIDIVNIVKIDIVNLPILKVLANRNIISEKIKILVTQNFRRYEKTQHLWE